MVTEVSLFPEDALIANILRVSDWWRSSQTERFGGIFLLKNNEIHVLHIAYQIIYNP